MYPEPGSNRHAFKGHWCLRPARLPIPPSGRKRDGKYSGIIFSSKNIYNRLISKPFVRLIFFALVMLSLTFVSCPPEQSEESSFRRMINKMQMLRQAQHDKGGKMLQSFSMTNSHSNAQRIKLSKITQLV